MVGFRGIAAAALMSGLLLAPAHAEQQTALTKEQAQAIAAYDKALAKFKVILAKRRAQIAAKKTVKVLFWTVVIVVAMRKRQPLAAKTTPAGPPRVMAPSAGPTGDVPAP